MDTFDINFSFMIITILKIIIDYVYEIENSEEEDYYINNYDLYFDESFNIITNIIGMK